MNLGNEKDIAEVLCVEIELLYGCETWTTESTDRDLRILKCGYKEEWRE